MAIEITTITTLLLQKAQTFLEATITTTPISFLLEISLNIIWSILSPKSKTITLLKIGRILNHVRELTGSLIREYKISSG
jgi:hypothetical protein